MSIWSLFSNTHKTSARTLARTTHLFNRPVFPDASHPQAEPGKPQQEPGDSQLSKLAESRIIPVTFPLHSCGTETSAKTEKFSLHNRLCLSPLPVANSATIVQMLASRHGPIRATHRVSIDADHPKQWPPLDLPPAVGLQ